MCVNVFIALYNFTYFLCSTKFIVNIQNDKRVNTDLKSDTINGNSNLL